MFQKFGKSIPQSLVDMVSGIMEAKVEPDAPDADAIARKKRLQAIKDKQEDDAAERGAGEKKPSGTRTVAGTSYGGAKQKDEPMEEEDLARVRSLIQARKKQYQESEEFELHLDLTEGIESFGLKASDEQKKKAKETGEKFVAAALAKREKTKKESMMGAASSNLTGMGESRGHKIIADKLKQIDRMSSGIAPDHSINVQSTKDKLKDAANLKQVEIVNQKDTSVKEGVLDDIRAKNPDVSGEFKKLRDRMHKNLDAHDAHHHGNMQHDLKKKDAMLDSDIKDKETERQLKLARQKNDDKMWSHLTGAPHAKNESKQVELDELINPPKKPVKNEYANATSYIHKDNTTSRQNGMSKKIDPTNHTIRPDGVVIHNSTGRQIGVASKPQVKEESLIEISKKVLGSYIQKASSPTGEKSNVNLASRAAAKLADDGEDDGEKDDRKAYHRSIGIGRAAGKLAKEATDTETKDASGKVTSWQHTGDWKKSAPGHTGTKTGKGKVAHLSDFARKKTTQMASEESVSEESLDEISADLVGRYSDKANKEYNDPKTSEHKKATRRAGLMLGYNKAKGRANVPATYKEEAEEFTHGRETLSYGTGIHPNVAKELHKHAGKIEAIFHNTKDNAMAAVVHNSEDGVHGDHHVLHFINNKKVHTTIHPTFGDAEAHGVKTVTTKAGLKHLNKMHGLMEEVEIDEGVYSDAKKNSKNAEHYPKAGESLPDYKKRMSDSRAAADKKTSDFVKKTFTKEEAEELDELSKGTLASYVKGAAADLPRLGNTLGRLQTHGKLKDVEKRASKHIINRYRGIGRAADKLAKEDSKSPGQDEDNHMSPGATARN